MLVELSEKMQDACKGHFQGWFLKTKECLGVSYVTVHGKTYVNDLSLKRKNQRTTNEQRTNVPNVSTNYPNVSSIWTEKYERVKAKIHTIF